MSFGLSGMIKSFVEATQSFCSPLVDLLCSSIAQVSRLLNLLNVLIVVLPRAPLSVLLSSLVETILLIVSVCLAKRMWALLVLLCQSLPLGLVDR